MQDENRMPSNVEEIVVYRNVLQPEELLPNLGDRSLDFVGRSRECRIGALESLGSYRSRHSACCARKISRM